MQWDAQGNATPARKRNDSGRLNKVAKNGLKGQNNCYPLTASPEAQHQRGRDIPATLRLGRRSRKPAAPNFPAS